MNGGFISSLFKKKADEEESCEMKFGLARVFKYQELKKATNSFATELGHGGYGRVYLGKLRDGQMVAVKVLFDRNPKRLEQFFNEVTVLSRVRHKNLIALYGCTNPTSPELLLVYEYVPNGTVADHLHGQQSALNWAARIRIAVEAAEALAYLHGLEPPIIHRDVKTSNILLDHTFHAKVADLGICRLLPWDTEHVSTLPQGTMGYRDPEYDRCFRLTDKTDVYSFGVVIMELISGQQAVDVTRDHIYLDVMAISKIVNDKLEEFVDPKLGYQTNNDIRRMINSVAQLAADCLQPLGNLRPSMVQVVTVLRGFQNEMEQIGLNEFVSLSSNPQKELGEGSLDHLNNDRDNDSCGSPLEILQKERPAIPLAGLRRLTGNFGQEALIGKGERYHVYKATLNTGKPVAIKKQVPDSRHLKAREGGNTDPYFLEENKRGLTEDQFNMLSMHEAQTLSTSEGDVSLPGIEGFRITGEAKPGCTLQACGYPTRGTSLCMFQWVRHLQDGTRHSVEGATVPEYLVTADDVDTYLAVDCIPIDEKGRQGELVSCFANYRNKIACDPDMQREIDAHILSGRAFFSVRLWIDSSEDWETMTSVFERSWYQVKPCFTDDAVIKEKYSTDLHIKIPCGLSAQFMLICSNGTLLPFSTEGTSRPYSLANDNRLRDIIVLTMRIFQAKALNGKRKGNVQHLCCAGFRW